MTNIRSMFLFLMANCLMVIACQKKALPVISTRTVEPPAPKPEVVLTTADPEAGKLTFTNRCSRCHGLPDISKYSGERWDGILAIMSPRARLSKQQEVNVTAYIKANTAK